MTIIQIQIVWSYDVTVFRVGVGFRVRLMVRNRTRVRVDVRVTYPGCLENCCWTSVFSELTLLVLWMSLLDDIVLYPLFHTPDPKNNCVPFTLTNPRFRPTYTVVPTIYSFQVVYSCPCVYLCRICFTMSSLMSQRSSSRHLLCRKTCVKRFRFQFHFLMELTVVDRHL